MPGSKVFLLLAALPLLAACNTVDGLGQDVQAAGRGVSNAAGYVEREVFGSNSNDTRRAEVVQRGDVSVGRACDPNPELSGGGGLPPCRVSATRNN